MDKYIVSVLDKLSNERNNITVYGIKWAVKATKIVLDNGYECVICKGEPSAKEVLERQIRW